MVQTRVKTEGVRGPAAKIERSSEGVRKWKGGRTLDGLRPKR